MVGVLIETILHCAISVTAAINVIPATAATVVFTGAGGVDLVVILHCGLKMAQHVLHVGRLILQLGEAGWVILEFKLQVRVLHLQRLHLLDQLRVRRQLHLVDKPGTKITENLRKYAFWYLLQTAPCCGHIQNQNHSVTKHWTIQLCAFGIYWRQRHLVAKSGNKIRENLRNMHFWYLFAESSILWPNLESTAWTLLGKIWLKIYIHSLELLIWWQLHLVAKPGINRMDTIRKDMT